MATSGKGFQLRYSIARKGFKNNTISGVVIADNQVNAVAEGKKTMENLVNSLEVETSYKLISCTPLKTDFFAVAIKQEAVEEESLKEKTNE